MNRENLKTFIRRNPDEHNNMLLMFKTETNRKPHLSADKLSQSLNITTN